MGSTYKQFISFLCIITIGLMVSCGTQERGGKVMPLEENAETYEEPVSEEGAPLIDLPKDSDNDGLFDQDEIDLYQTDPDDPDSDDDKLTDFQEVKIYTTDPNLPDSDGDSFLDYDELLVHEPPTDPLNADDDNDGFHPLADQSGWPEEADCQPFDAEIFPGNMGPDGTGDKVDGKDIDCVTPDVKFGTIKMNKGYKVSITMETDMSGVYLFAKRTGENHGECEVDKTLSKSFDCSSWDDDMALGKVHNYNTGKNIASWKGGIGVKLEKFANGMFYKVTAVGKVNNHGSPYWGVWRFTVGE